MAKHKEVTILPSLVLDTKTGEIKPLPTDHNSQEYKDIMWRMHANKTFCGFTSVYEKDETKDAM